MTDAPVVSPEVFARAAVQARVAAVGAVLSGRVDELTDDVQHAIFELVPELRGSPAEVFRASVRANIETALREWGASPGVASGAAPDNAIEHAAALAHAEVTSASLMRAYRVGQTQFLRHCIEQLVATSSAPVDLLAALQIVESVSVRIDHVVEQAYDAYEQTRELMLRDRSAVLHGVVRELLRGDAVDIDATEAALGYRLRQPHVAVVVWLDRPRVDSLTALRRFTAALAERLRCKERPLFMAVDEQTAWVWFPTAVDLATDAALLEAAAPHTGVTVAVGEPGRLVDGFRRSHEQALGARAVALASGEAHVQITPFCEVAPLVWLCADLASARAWVHEALGGLVVDTSRNAGLRKTARVFLETGGSYTATADELYLHRNTAQYRVRKAEEVRGRPLRERRLDAEVALLACHWLKGAVLEPA